MPLRVRGNVVTLTNARDGVLTPVSVITGFLGSGKTTLLRRLLADARMANAAVLINEFGEVGLDHLLVRKVDENIVLLNSGCLCCTVRDDLVETLDELHMKRTSGEVPAFDRVVIETTGLADPAPIIHTVLTDPSLSPVYQLTGLVATVDATHGQRQLDEHMEAVQQVAMADRVVITKTDLADAATLDGLRQRLTALSPSAAILNATLETGPEPNELFDIALFSLDDKSADAQRWMNEEASGDGPHHHVHDVNRHDDRISTFCLTADTPIGWETFAEWLTLLLASRGDQLLRVKGLLNVTGRTRPVMVHGVQHVFYPPTELHQWPDRDRRSRIVMITRDLSRHAVEKSFQRVTLGSSTTARR
jgi:G3E family GTPase